MTLIFWSVHCLLMPSNTKCSGLDCRFSNRWMLIIMGWFTKRNLTQWRIRYQSTHTLSLCIIFVLLLAMTERYKGCQKKTNILLCFLHLKKHIAMHVPVYSQNIYVHHRHLMLSIFLIIKNITMLKPLWRIGRKCLKLISNKTLYYMGVKKICKE